MKNTEKTILAVTRNEKYAEREAYQAQKDFFEKLLEGYDIDCLPVPDTEYTGEEEDRISQEFFIEEELLAALEDKESVSREAFFTTVMGYLIAKYNYSQTSVISTVYVDQQTEHYGDSRTETEHCDDSRTETEHYVDRQTEHRTDMPIKSIPFVTDFSGMDSVSALLKACGSKLKACKKKRLYPFKEMAQELGVKNDIIFTFRGSDDAEIIEAYKSERRSDPACIEEGKLWGELSELEAGRYRFRMGYRRDCFSESFAAGFVKAYSNAAKEFLRKESLQDICLTDAQELARLDTFNDTDTDYDTKHTVVDLFRKNAEEIPENIAVVFKDTNISYADLDDRTDRLAYYLKQKGLGAEKVVAVLIPRSEHMAICSLGVLKSGAAYMPLDPSYPPERLNLMVQDSAAQILITTGELSGIIDESFQGERMLLEDVDALESLGRQYQKRHLTEADQAAEAGILSETMSEAEAGKAAGEELLKAAPKPEDLFIMLYTSGSTGIPKGVMLEHFNLMTFTAWCSKDYRLSRESRNAAYASYGFDACMLDMYPILTAGGRLYIIPEELRLDLVAVHKYFEENAITHGFMTTQIARQFVNLGATGSLKLLATGGEKLVSMDPPAYLFRNVYGPTEATIFVTLFDLDKRYRDIPIGKPLDNVKLYVVDTEGKRLPVGAAGELWIAGPQVSRGYLNRPEKTAEVFLDNPFDQNKKYRRTYKTGDVVRFLADGNVQFVGRRDAPVKVRGFRIELTEVEEVIRRAPGVRDVSVQAYDDAAGGKYLCAYLVADEPGLSLDIQNVNDFIMAEKPPYMVPAVSMQIDAIPYNQNQKVNKKALPVPERKAEDMTPPENERQEKIFTILAEILGHKEFGIHTDIYAAGLSSIGAVQLNVKLSEAFDIVLKTRDLKENATVKKLEVLISAAAEDVDAAEDKADQMERAEAARISLAAGREVSDQEAGAQDDADRSYSLTKTQQGIFAECMAHPASTIYNLPFMYELKENFDVEQLKEAVCKAFNNHPYVLGRLFMAKDGSVKCRKNDSPAFAPADIEEHALPGGDRQSVIRYAQSLVRPFRLVAAVDREADRLVRVFLIRAKVNYILIDMHHIISDGTSLNILFDDISAAYEGKELIPETLDGYEIALAEEKALASKKYDKARAFYRELLEGADTDCAPAGDVHDRVEEQAGLFSWESDLHAGELKAFCAANAISPVTLFNAAFGYVLSKYIYKEDVVYSTIYNGRNDPRMAHTISMLVKTLPVRCRYTKNQTVRSYLEDVEYQMADAMSHDIYSFAEICREFDVNADIMFTYQGELFHFDRFCGQDCKAIELELDTAKAYMDMDIYVDGDKVSLVSGYRRDIYSEDFVREFSKILCKAVRELTCRERMGELQLIGPEMQAQLDVFNATAYPVADECAHRMFERQAAAAPEKTAVIAAGESLTYGELNALANRLAHGLIERGVATGEIVGLISDRSKEVFIGELGIMKAGAAFLPMVAEYPDDRIDYCLTDADSRFVITSKAIAEEKAELFADKSYRLLTFEEILREGEEENPDVEIPTDSLCYCIYTSGSTGMPKGVMIEHRNFRNFLDPNEKNPETANYVKYGHVVLSVISIAFDFSLMETQLPLANGLTVYMASQEEIHDPVALAKKMLQHHVDVMSGTPSFIGNMIDVPQVKEALANMKLYDFGAEAFTAGLFDKLRKVSPQAVICNGYGPTEATISCISKPLDRGEGITIGWPSANVMAYVCDKDMKLLPIGAVGELVIAGAGVGRGYVKLPDKTAAVFVQLKKDGSGICSGEEAAFGEDESEKTIRAYRTGDRVRLLQSGEIEFFGRLDNQVKLRGFRVELDEIENNLNSFPGVQMSKVIVRNNGSEDYLAGFFTADRKLDLSQLTAHLKEKLTYYMVPSVLMQLEEMPLTVNGKIDKKKLPEVEFSAQREYVAPETDLEKEICDVFAEVLHQERISVRDDFFEIGGTSLTATSIVLKLADLGRTIVYKDVFTYATPRELAEFISGEKLVSKGFSDAFDYSSIKRLLDFNTMEHIDNVRKKDPGNIILTGATGFLGIHVLYEFLTKYEGTVYCLVRKGRYESPQKRLQNMWMYYHGNVSLKQYEDRVKCLNGDITDPAFVKGLGDLDADRIINCAALVKHFVKDDSLDRINVGGVKNLIELCLESGQELLQISTVSVGGNVTGADKDKRISENELYFGQIIDNDYIRTKFLAEREILKAVSEKGLKAKIIRVGNLMSRASDGEFQINFITNGFMRSLKAFKQLGAFPMTSMYAPAEFSPIDSTAGAILALAGQESAFTVFHAYNSHIIYMSDVIYAMKRYGFSIDIVSDERFGEIMEEAAKDDRFSDALLGLIAYNSDSQEVQYEVDANNRFTTEVLYRLAYLWPITDNDYLYNAINILDGFGFFDLED